MTNEKLMREAMQAVKESGKATRKSPDAIAEAQAIDWHNGANDDGIVGKRSDVLVRYILTGKLEYCHRAGNSDVKGRGFAVEVKQAQGWLVNPCYSSKEEAQAALEKFNRLPAQFVAYAWKTDGTISGALADFRIVSSTAFVKFLKSINKIVVKRGSTASGNGAKWGFAVQSFHGSAKALAKLEQFLSNGWTLLEHSAEYEYYCD